MLRFVVGVRRETLAAHLLADRQRVLGDVPVTATARVVVVDAVVVVVRRQVHEYVLHVDGDAERLLEYRRADGLVLFAAAKGQHDGAYAEQDERGGRQHADEHLHQSAAPGPVVLLLVRG